MNFTKNSTLRVWLLRMPWGVFSAALYALVVLAYAVAPYVAPYISPASVGKHNIAVYPHYIMDIFVGGATVCLMLYCTRYLTDGVPAKRPLILRFLEARPTVSLGEFSYSLYLTHFPILVAAMTLMQDVGLSSGARLVTAWTVVVPLALLFAYLFSRVFERPFMTHLDKRLAAVR